MKVFAYAAAAALLMSGTATAVTAQTSGSDPDGRQGQMNPNGALPPGTGITALGHDPEGQSFTPPGYNMGMSVMAYPPVTAAPPGLIGGEYPICSARVTDRCLQAYTRLAGRSR